MRWVIYGLVFTVALRAQAGLPVVKASVGEPVVQALMGGCSLRCAFPWETAFVVPGGKAVATYDLDDNSASTAWIDPNTSTGTKLVMQFPNKLPPEFRDNIPFYGIDVANGRIKPLEEFKNTARVKKLRMYYNDKPICDILLADSWRWQHVTFDDLMANQGDRVTFEILEKYPGSRSQSAAITEFILQGAH